MLQSPQFLGSLGHSSFARIIAKLASMWLATRNTNMDFISHDALPLVITHTLFVTTPPRAHYILQLVWYILTSTHCIPLLACTPSHAAAKKPSDSTDAGEGEGEGKKRPQMTDSRRQQYTSNMLYVRENTVINYYSILIIVVGRKLHNQQRTKTTLS